MNKLINLLILLISTFAFSQTLKKVSPDFISNESSVNETKMSSYIYFKNESNYEIVKNDIYNFFDSQISLEKSDYNPNIDSTTDFLFYVYRKTNILDTNFTFNENANPETNPMIYNHNSDIIAIVSYKLVGKLKSISFYSNKTLQRVYIGNKQKEISKAYRSLVGNID